MRSRMKVPVAIGAAILSASCHAGPTNAQMNEMWLFSTYLVCVTQDPQYENSPSAAMLAKAPGFQGWEVFRSQPRSQCFRARQWVPKSLCDDVVEIIAQEEHSQSLRKLLSERRQEVIEVESVVRLYFQPAVGSVPFHCPVERPTN